MKIEKGEIKELMDCYDQEQLECNPEYAPTNRDIIELIDSYWVSKYKGGEYDSTGAKKSFYNIIINPSEVASKMIDIDTKDVKVIAEDGNSYYPSWLLGKELKIWMKDKKNKDGQTFGQFLNQLVYNFPKYGHLIAKKAGDTVHLVPIQNLYCSPDAKNFMSSDIIVEQHEFSEEGLRKMKGWKNIEDTITKCEQDGIILVYEVHINSDEKENYFVYAEGAESGDYLYKSKIKREDLYKEIKWEDIPGRPLGRGQVEKLFEAQIAKNQNEHLLRSGYKWTSKKLWQTRDDNVAKNLITELEDGDVLTVNSEITPISMEERNLSAINTGDEKWDALISKLSFSYENLSGSRDPSGTPYSATLLRTQMAGQYYGLKKEELGMFVKGIIVDWILPEFKKQKNGAHVIMMSDFDENEIDKLRKLIVGNKTNRRIVDFIGKNKKIPRPNEIELLKSITEETVKNEKEITIPEKFYDNLKYKIDIVITDEQIDMASKLTSLQTVLQILGSNPTILKDPSIRRVFYQMLNLMGISPLDFQTEDTPDLQQSVQNMGAQVGGSIARPQVQNTPQPGTNLKRL